MATDQKLPAGCIGHKSEFLLDNGLPDYEALAGKFIDGDSGLVFNSNKELNAFLFPPEEKKEEQVKS